MDDMDLFDRRILTVLKDRKYRSFKQIPSESRFSHNTLRLHMAQLMEQGLMVGRKMLQKGPARPLFTYSPSRGVDGRAISTLMNLTRGYLCSSARNCIACTGSKKVVL